MLWARQCFETRLKLNMVKWCCLYFILQMSKIPATASVELNIVLPHLSLFLYGSFNVYQAVAFLTHWVFLKIPKQETYNQRGIREECVDIVLLMTGDRWRWSVIRWVGSGVCSWWWLRWLWLPDSLYVWMRRFFCFSFTYSFEIHDRKYSVHTMEHQYSARTMEQDSRFGHTP